MSRAGPSNPPKIDTRVIVHELRGARPGRIIRVTPAGTRLGIVLDRQGPDGQFTPSALSFPVVNADYQPSVEHYSVRGRARVEIVERTDPKLMRQLRLDALCRGDDTLRDLVEDLYVHCANEGYYLNSDDTHSLNYLIREYRRDHDLDDTKHQHDPPFNLYP